MGNLGRQPQQEHGMQKISKSPCVEYCIRGSPRMAKDGTPLPYLPPPGGQIDLSIAKDAD